MNNENILKHWDKKTLIESYYKSIARASGILSDVYDEEEDYSLKVKEEDDWMHSRSVYSKYGSAAPKNLMKAIGQDFWLKKEATKHRYIYFLGSKAENRKFRKVMKHPEMRYPKNYVQEVEITKVEVENNKWEN